VAAADKPLSRGVIFGTMKALLISSVTLLLLTQGCLIAPYSTRSGGTGMVLHGENPVVGAQVLIDDLDGVVSTTTDENGRFEIDGEGKRVLYPAMSNQGFRDITLRVEKKGFQSHEVILRKSAFGEYEYEYGIIQLSKNVGPKPN
jgi:hypothetical protein